MVVTLSSRKAISIKSDLMKCIVLLVLLRFLIANIFEATLQWKPNDHAAEPLDLPTTRTSTGFAQDGNSNTINATTLLAVSINKQELKSHNTHRYFRCGHRDQMPLFTRLFPEYKNANEIKLQVDSARKSTSKDILFNGMHGKCGGYGESKLDQSWMAKHFKGQVIHINGEPFGGDDWYYHHQPRRQQQDNVAATASNSTQQQQQSLPFPRQYHLGYVADYDSHPDNHHQQALQVTRAAVVVASLPQKYWDHIFDPSQKPINTQEHFLIYTASNCLDWRESAFVEFSKINIVHHGGPCLGRFMKEPKVDVRRSPRIQKSPHSPQKRHNSEWQSNMEWSKHYRYCMVLENSYVEGYVSEKIIMAYLAGCVPIYYGTLQVFDMFHSNSFIYFNRTHPQETYKRLEYLESNRSAYTEMLQAPILAHGSETIEKYFSLADGMGNATRKKKIRAMLGFPPESTTVE